jgi:type II secretory pathway component GspD/PulD (secretin)
VTAPKDLMVEIAGIMEEIDVPSTRDQNVYTVQLKNADPQQVAQVLQNMVGGNNSRNTSGNNSALMQRLQNGVTTMGTTTTSTGINSSSGGATGRGN